MAEANNENPAANKERKNEFAAMAELAYIGYTKNP